MSFRITTASESERPPLCVDLDGTLVNSDLLWESLLAVLRSEPQLIFAIGMWFLRGRPVLKHRLAERVSLDPAFLPFNQDLLAYLRNQKAAGRTIILATATNVHLATRIALHVGVFDGVVASDGATNVKGRTKLRLLAQQFPDGFEYAGNSSSDLPIWRGSRRAVLVNVSCSTIRALGTQSSPSIDIFSRSNPCWKPWVRALRIHQWTKNVLVLVPLIASHRVLDITTSYRAVTAAIAFCLCASSAYILNDLLDIDADRQHHSKRLRPFASGALPIWAGALAIPTLFAASLTVGALSCSATSWVLSGYFLCTVCYSTQLKKIALVDVFTLASLYTARLIAGHLAADIPFSNWLLSFGFLLFLSLAFSKRSTELFASQTRAEPLSARRGYVTNDLNIVNLLGVSAGISAGVVLTLYITSDKVRTLYRQPAALWLLVPMMLYWISRVWLWAARGQLDEDPIVFALRDHSTHILGVVALIIVIVAALGWLPVEMQ